MEKTIEYRGITEEDYKNVMAMYSERMFKLFDKEPRTYGNGNRGLCLMWLGTWTSSLIAREVVDMHLDRKISLFNALIEVLKETSPDQCISLEAIKRTKIKYYLLFDKSNGRIMATGHNSESLKELCKEYASYCSPGWKEENEKEWEELPLDWKIKQILCNDFAIWTNKKTKFKEYETFN